ncbi:ATP-binding protein [Bacillus sp. FJAT-27231]|uniref:ATP-binding protein n=1 Tax=Bacillus sp. FJAT-27231 TaxID=1679168 RepID=UPI000A6A5763|nr:ATP-binding protein [Bacillus sp. FJAT-27231]
MGSLVLAKRIYPLPSGFCRMNADLVMVDELGYIPYHPRAAELMFQFFSARYERGSMIITSNREFSRWNEVFHDDQMKVALLDRITH